MNSVYDETRDSALVVVDMLNDFIDGSMACANAKEAVNRAAEFIDSMTAGEKAGDGEIFGQFPILFICDHHPADHCSFVQQGGQWPSHCIVDTRGSAIHDMLTPYVSEELTFYKGCEPDNEQYSGHEGRNKAGQSVSEVLDLLDIRTVYVCGIATEYCVRATAEDLAADGKKVIIIGNALGYVGQEGHLKALEEMREKGMQII